MTWGGKTTSLYHEGAEISLGQLHNKKITHLFLSQNCCTAVFGVSLEKWFPDKHWKLNPSWEKLNLLPNYCPHFFSQGQSTPAMTDLILWPKISPLLLPFHKEIGSKSTKAPFSLHLGTSVPKSLQLLTNGFTPAEPVSEAWCGFIFYLYFFNISKFINVAQKLHEKVKTELKPLPKPLKRLKHLWPTQLSPDQGRF